MSLKTERYMHRERGEKEFDKGERERDREKQRPNKKFKYREKIR
jgi:hypothetical protein